jgi:hypothetical protein
MRVIKRRLKWVATLSLGDINQRPGPPGWGLGVGLTTLPCKKKIVEKPPRNLAGFCGGGQGLSWAVEPRKEEEEDTKNELMFLWPNNGST